MIKLSWSQISFTYDQKTWLGGKEMWVNWLLRLVLLVLTGVSIYYFISFYTNGLGLAYNDARSHLDIGRRVVEGLKPGLAQLGSVWLPLPHLLMVPTIWNDFMWHSGLAGALQSMISFVATGVIVYLFLQELGVGILGRLMGVVVFAANLNILYLQSTAMTELLLLATMMAGIYELVKWCKTDQILFLIRGAFWVMLATLIRYEGWFLLLVASSLVFYRTWRQQNYHTAEGKVILFGTLAAFGIALWFLWNALIFKDPFYFVFGPFSAAAQQAQLARAGVLVTKGNFWFSLKIYLYALIYNAGAFTAILGAIGLAVLFWDRKLKRDVRWAAAVFLVTPLVFNVLALYLGHSVLFIQGLSGNTWFNVRYGVMMLPSIAIFTGFLVDRVRSLRWLVIGLFLFVTVFAFANHDAVTIDDARVGSSQKNVSEVSDWLKEHAKNETGFVLISAASHDAIIFSSGLPMKRFIHEGTGAYWESATTTPDRWARWIVMRTYDDNDLTWKTVSRTPGFASYTLVAKYPFADVYEIQPEYVKQLNTAPILGKQK
ncbi:MAG: Glycosyl transferase family 2 [Candidatus Gottesmanbacteria bacterium GW2011_GWB1_43_11]|uniref:Glycosyl transferase family 2 n=1 Tax=Candidatus Gottesmanbacteria bacterium GW2011_GWB1_43_11 TaxID=1618446 RepID=A0A0G1CPU3_9BACT|nr:MAG: Glycosyl transferase family 2 [Candidatus Gottesmanbacteria bacterium GW2011_GWA2_42_16]KKS56007.1 MAG: Glycosyl transferase family 2 [Candidatus Gottesmanbacteria bacterium GW2011_GWA1_42_26]KKS80264.1 MAG: family 2 glycosyl transferase [Candidatus Gottesmanbacteria bacterium GW2011_GWC1_43_10]KKS87569.1 MAG: Glycosyl transferase family 2 [Candidatus Gottesmanbacteria bacterium GW2011_GWB1_43_11]OGG10380.1 MAG: hypothetical protein A2699_01070 [Candidatus Gottesmanbacteria bacterium RI